MQIAISISNFKPRRHVQIWLAVHGQSQYEEDGRIGGDSGLSYKGQRYAVALEEQIAGSFPTDLYSNVALWTSTLRRATESARRLEPRFPNCRTRPELNEIYAGAYECMSQAMKTRPEIEAEINDKLNYHPPGNAESFKQLIARMTPLLHEIDRLEDSVIIVAHRSSLAVIYGYLHGIPPSNLDLLFPPNTLSCLDCSIKGIAEQTYEFQLQHGRFLKRTSLSEKERH